MFGTPMMLIQYPSCVPRRIPSSTDTSRCFHRIRYRIGLKIDIPTPIPHTGLITDRWAVLLYDDYHFRRVA